MSHADCGECSAHVFGLFAVVDLGGGVPGSVAIEFLQVDYFGVGAEDEDEE